MNKKIGQTQTELIVENQFRNCGRLPRLPLPKTDAERDARADGVAERVFREAGWDTAAKIIAARSAPPPAKSRVDEIVESQLALAGQPIPRS